MISKFQEYVLSFYGDGGLYPMGATPEIVAEATATHLQILSLQGKEFCGDSVDRELVRDLMISRHKLSTK